MKPVPGLLIAAPRSGAGKTTLSLGLMRAFRRRGLAVRGLKNGPDYIDPAFHAAATGRASYNLDSFAMPAELLDALVAEAAREADLIVAEGSMGLFDGIRGEIGRTGASADLAARFGWPVILMLDLSGHAQTAGAIALGCATFDPRLTLAGVVLNNVASPRHRQLAEDGLARAGIAVFGALDRNPALALPERHLGLVQAEEIGALAEHLDRLADAIEAALDLEAILAAAGGSLPSGGSIAALPPPPGHRIALARDAAFSFVYPHLLAGWQAAGAAIVPFSPLGDEAPPADCDCCWLPGGYPELHAGRLAAAEKFKAGLRDFAARRPVHGECGGYMVLGESLEDAAGTSHAMAGLLPVRTSFARRKLNLGYRLAITLADSAIGPAGTRLAGHEFHYSQVLMAEEAGRLASVTDAEARDLGPAGHVRGRVSGSYFHLIARQA